MKRFRIKNSLGPVNKLNWFISNGSCYTFFANNKDLKLDLIQKSIKDTMNNKGIVKIIHFPRSLGRSHSLAHSHTHARTHSHAQARTRTHSRVCTHTHSWAGYGYYLILLHTCYALNFSMFEIIWQNILFSRGSRTHENKLMQSRGSSEDGGVMWC